MLSKSLNELFGGITMEECPVCGGNIETESNLEKGEVLTCNECGSDLEVKSVDPLVLAEAPESDEDWGE